MKVNQFVIPSMELARAVVEICREAAVVMMEIYHKGEFEIISKQDDSPVTVADLMSNKIKKRIEYFKLFNTLFKILSFFIFFHYPIANTALAQIKGYCHQISFFFRGS